MCHLNTFEVVLQMSATTSFVSFKEQQFSSIGTVVLKTWYNYLFTLAALHINI